MFVFAAGIPRQHQRTSDCFENPKRFLLKPRGVASEDRASNDKDEGSDNDKEVAWEKKPTFRNASNGFPAKWRLRNERRNSVLITCHYPELGSASDWLKQISHPARPIRT